MGLQKTRSLWLLARPISIFPRGIVFCHWGVLVTELSDIDITVFISRRHLGDSSDITLGVLYDLRTEGVFNRVKVQITNPFLLSSVNLWKRSVSRFIGITTLSDDEIRTIGK